ncbi:MAG: hypothetical protein U0174_10620 [Polyangiaceae bacterium]
MQTMKSKLNKLRAKRGASMVEYALLLFAVLIIAAAAFKRLGSPVGQAAKDSTDYLKAGN